MVGIGNAPARVGPARGDIHIVDFPEIGGHVIRGPHPGVIVQTDRMQRSSTVVVIPLTSAAKAASFTPRFLVQIPGRASGLPRDGWAKCDQPFTIPTASKTGVSHCSGRPYPSFVRHFHHFAWRAGPTVRVFLLSRSRAPSPYSYAIASGMRSRTA